MYETLNLNCKIRWCQFKIESCQNSFKFWQQKEKDLREQYGNTPSQIQCSNIRRVKKMRKDVKQDFEYWTLELVKLRKKLDINTVFV